MSHAVGLFANVSSHRRRVHVRDLLFIAITAAFFSLSFAYAKAFDHL
jgi:hypothetical protein